MSSFGDNLRRERELRGIRLREISQGTKISLRFLQAVEDDRLDLLPGGMFPRAFVRQYADYLGLDVERTLAAFNDTHGTAPVEKRPAKPPPLVAWRQVAWMIVGGVALLVVVLMSGRPSSRARQATAPAPLPILVSSPSRALPPPAPPPAEIEGLVLTLKAEQECWVEARADGRSVLNRVLTAGETTTLEATGEIRLSVGNAGGLTLNLNNLPGLPLGRNGEVKKNILINRDNLPALVQKTAALSSSSSG
jgi:cytoskeleton protein RodZ